jgi:hypothetical protein
MEWLRLITIWTKEKHHESEQQPQSRAVNRRRSRLMEMAPPLVRELELTNLDQGEKP